MRLLNPVAWLGALLVALPIAIHLFSRQPARTVAFPSLRFLDITRVLPTRRTSLTDLLLLLLRVLIVLAAVFALSQPLFATGGGASTARAVIVESADSSDAGLAVDSLLPSAAQRLVTRAPQVRDNLAGALAWLRAQSGSRELVLVVPTSGASLDSLDVQRVPSDVRVIVDWRAPRRVAPSYRVTWAARAGDVNASAITSAVRAVAGDSAVSGASREIIVATSDADSLASWRALAQPIAQPWMGDALARLRRDSTVAVETAGLALTDTAVSAPWVAVTRTNTGAPVAIAASIGPRLLVVLRGSGESTSLAHAAMLLAAYRVGTASAPMASAPFDSVTAARWIAARPAGITLGYTAAATDYRTGPSNARFAWVAVLLLLGVETLVRRRMKAVE